MSDAVSSGDDHTTDTETAHCSNEERVRHLLRQHGGSLPQSDIVTAADWSKATVSRLLSDMDSAGDIVKRQFGRENRIWLAGHQPELTERVSAEGTRGQY
jgi:uncharacterized membrane protein